MPYRLLIPLVLAALLGCAKTEVQPPEETPETFHFPLTLERSATVIEEPIRVFINVQNVGSPGSTWHEIPADGLALTNHPVFTGIGADYCQKLTFTDAEHVEISPCPQANKAYVRKEGEAFRWTIYWGSAMCEIKAQGDYDRLAIPCQAFVSRGQDGTFYSKDFFRDACFEGQAFDTGADTVAVLNYTIELQ
jgi:hypothetical protein